MHYRKFLSERKRHWWRQLLHRVRLVTEDNRQQLCACCKLAGCCSCSSYCCTMPAAVNHISDRADGEIETQTTQSCLLPWSPKRVIVWLGNQCSSECIILCGVCQ
jgi:hypothetical protein